MEQDDYISVENVRAVCKKLNISDWSSKTDATVDDREAAIVRDAIGGAALDVSVAEFRYGLEVELEHGRLMPDCNITNNHPLATGRIVLAHLAEGLDYYSRLKCMELEMELAAAIASGNAAKAAAKRRALVDARIELQRRIGATAS